MHCAGNLSQVASISEAWDLQNSLPVGVYDSQVWVLRSGSNYSMQVMVYQEFNDGTRCYNTTATVTMVDNGMDGTARCSPATGGCALKYTYDPSLNVSDRGIQYGVFAAGQPNAAAVSVPFRLAVACCNAPSPRRLPASGLCLPPEL